MSKSRPISFRLDPDSRDKVDEKAANLGIRVSDYARKVMLSSLDEESELAKLQMRLTALEDTVSGLREDLAVAVKALLVTAGSNAAVSPEQAETWVNSNMRNVG